MKRFIDTIKNIWSIEELKNKILYTLILLAVYRLGCHIVLPGISNPGEVIQSSNGLLNILDMFSGGAFNKMSIFALGVMPYISASIAIQLLGFAIPQFQKMQKEESGRTKLNQYTRYLTILVTLVQGFAYYRYLLQSGAEHEGLSSFTFQILITLVLTAGTLFVMWLGEKMTDKGIGNGTSIIIMAGIIARFPDAIFQEFTLKNSGGAGGGLLIFLIEIVMMFVIIMGIILLVQGVRKIPINYARQMASGSSNVQVGGARQFIPIKVNGVGVMPIIFAQALLFIPASIAGVFNSAGSKWVTALGDPTSLWYNLIYAVLVIVFTYFYTALTVNTTQMSDELKRSSAFIPGIKPGLDTSNYIGSILDRITLPGALLLAFIGILPGFAKILGVGQGLASFYGGTSMLIMVGVMIDTLQQIESYLLMKKYDGLMSGGSQIQGRYQSPVSLNQY